MQSNWKTHVALCGLALVPVVAWSALAPAPFSTGPTPIGSLPFTINDPGTYCLTGNLTAGAGVAGIDVQADDVVIDLGGFRLDGGGDSDGDGIRSTGRNLTVCNGTISGWGGVGIELFFGGRVSDVSVYSEGYAGILVGTGFSRVERSVVQVVAGPDTSPAVAGIGVAAGGIVDSCQVAIIGTQGPEVGSAIGTGQGGMVVDCMASGGKFGIEAGNGSRVVRSTSGAAATIGIQAGPNTRVDDCDVLFANTAGVATGGGIVGSADVRIEDCGVWDTNGTGIELRNASFGRIERCDVRRSQGDGIVTQGNTHVLENRIYDNMGAGIRVLGDRCVLLENLVDRNSDRGIVVDGRTSHLERNLAAFNKGGDYDLEWGNPFGKIERPSGQMTTFESQTNYKTPFGF